jgi:hydrogenase maturation protein HypF
MVEKLAAPIGEPGAPSAHGAATALGEPTAHGAPTAPTAPSAPSAPGLRVPAVALSGGVFQNRILLERVTSGLEQRGYRVLTHAQVPCNDGGLALGQSVIAAARMLGFPPEPNNLPHG